MREGGARGRCVANGFTNVVSPKVNDCGAEPEKEGGGGGKRETISHQRKDFSREIIPGPKEKSPNEGKNPTREREGRQKKGRCRGREGGKKSVQSSALSGRARPRPLVRPSVRPLVDKSRDLHYLLLPQRQKATRRVILRGRGEIETGEYRAT